MIKLEIDGQPVEAQPGSMVIQAADEVGIYNSRLRIENASRIPNS